MSLFFILRLLCFNQHFLSEVIRGQKSLQLNLDLRIERLRIDLEVRKSSTDFAESVSLIHIIAYKGLTRA